MGPPSGTEGSVRFVVACPARSGSSLLMGGLRGHPDATVHGEPFGVDARLGLHGLDPETRSALEVALERLRDRDPVRFLQDIVFEAGGRRAVGLKFKYEELLLRRWEPVARYLARDRGVLVVHLTRDNLLERYLSEEVVRRVTGLHSAREASTRPAGIPIRLEPDSCRADFDRTLARQRQVARLFAPHRVLDLTYEELLADWGAVMARLQRFLDLDVRPLEQSLVKLRNLSLAESITNFDELSDALAGTPYARFLTPSAGSQADA